MPNRLADSTSPYLQQHRDNPVDWWEWSPEAFAEARRRDVPVLLSVGYAACHWCHVMAHESFEDDETAAVMNEHFVNIKVDREERPDIDAVYMEATQAMSGHGGWPMTAFLTPRGEPFFCGTYFPPAPRHGMPSFGQLLTSVAAAWQERRGEVEAAGADVVRRLHREPLPAGDTRLDADTLDAAVTSLAASYDRQDAGFGRAPKFPPSMVLEFLLRARARTGSDSALAMVEHTCERMARGGMYDQLAGGFARYSVDGQWVVPHFEKMLYDNALLLRVYLHLWRETGSPLAERVARQTAEFLLRDLRTPEGGFASALDADTEGEEGRTYVWTPAQLREVLGEDDGRYAAQVFAVSESGTFEHGTSVLQLPADPDDPQRFADLRARLLRARCERPQPARDDKVVAAWNGLAIAALAEAGALLAEPSYVDAAGRCADLLLDVHRAGSRLVRTSRDGRAGRSTGVLEDYANLATGLLVLHQVSADPRRLSEAGALLEVALEHFADGAGGFYDTADDAETLVRRPQDPTDNATPSGSAATAGALVTYAALTASERHREAAERALAVVAPLAGQHARFVGEACSVGEALLAGPVEVAVVGESDRDRASPSDRTALERTARLGTSPGALVVAGQPDQAGVPLLADRPLVGGRAAAYVCRHFVCAAPVVDPAALREPLRVRLDPLAGAVTPTAEEVVSDNSVSV